MDNDRRETGENEAGEAGLHQGKRAPFRAGRAQVGERQCQTGLQARGAVARQRMKGQARQKLAE